MKCVMLLAMVAVCASVASAETGTWKVPRWSPVLTAPDAVKKVIDGKCPGHSQGMCATSNALFFSFHNQVVKTNLAGTDPACWVRFRCPLALFGEI